MPSFFVVKRRLTKVAAEHVSREAVVGGLFWVSTKNYIYCIMKGMDIVSVPPSQYSSGHRSNNNAIQLRLVIAWSWGRCLG